MGGFADNLLPVSAAVEETWRCGERGPLTGSPVGRGCKQDISLHVLSLPGQQIGAHGEPGNGMSSISAPSKEGDPLCQTRSDGMEHSSMDRAAGRRVFCFPCSSSPPFNLLLPNTCPEVPHEKRDEVAGRDTRCLGLHQHQPRAGGMRARVAPNELGLESGEQPSSAARTPPVPDPGGAWGTR